MDLELIQVLIVSHDSLHSVSSVVTLVNVYVDLVVFTRIAGTP